MAGVWCGLKVERGKPPGSESLLSDEATTKQPRLCLPEIFIAIGRIVARFFMRFFITSSGNKKFIYWVQMPRKLNYEQFPI